MLAGATEGTMYRYNRDVTAKVSLPYIAHPARLSTSCQKSISKIQLLNIEIETKTNFCTLQNKNLQWSQYTYDDNNSNNSIQPSSSS